MDQTASNPDGNMKWYRSRLDQARSVADYSLASVVQYRIVEKQVTELLQDSFPFYDWELPPYSKIVEQFLRYKQSLFAGFPMILPRRPGFTDKLILIHLLWPNSLGRELIKQLVDTAETRHQSWLIHGDKVVGKDEFLEMEDVYQSASMIFHQIKTDQDVNS